MINRLPKAQSGHPNGKLHKPSVAATAPMTQRITQSAARCIGEHPVAALGLALVAGLALGWVVKR
jgi:hypothetical protein